MKKFYCKRYMVAVKIILLVLIGRFFMVDAVEMLNKNFVNLNNYKVLDVEYTAEYMVINVYLLGMDKVLLIFYF